jgi:hypothetical protein
MEIDNITYYCDNDYLSNDVILKKYIDNIVNIYLTDGIDKYPYKLINFMCYQTFGIKFTGFNDNKEFLFEDFYDKFKTFNNGISLYQKYNEMFSKYEGYFDLIYVYIKKCLDS